MASANERQVGGGHYKDKATGLWHTCRKCNHKAFIPLQHWDIVNIFKLDYFQGQITKYVMRWRDKNGVQDLHKGEHFMQKYLELNYDCHDDEGGTTRGYVVQERLHAADCRVHFGGECNCGWGVR